MAEAPVRRSTLLQSSPVDGLPGWETRLYLIEYGPGVDTSGHAHPVVGLGYMLEGSVESAFGDEAPETFHAGESFVDQANVTHTVSRNPSATETMRFVIAYTVKVGEPVVTGI